jgi:hypothetical protein
MSCVSLSLREEIRQLELWRHILKRDDTILNLCLSIVNINTNILSKLMFYRIASNTNDTYTIGQKRSQQTQKDQNPQATNVTK